MLRACRGRVPAGAAWARVAGPARAAWSVSMSMSMNGNRSVAGARRGGGVIGRLGGAGAAAGIALLAGASFALGLAAAPGSGQPGTTTRGFVIHTAESAPEASRAALGVVRERFGLVPNMIGTLADSPAALDAYLSMSAAMSQGTLTAVEQNVVSIAAARANACSYCVPAHSAVGASKLGMSPELVAALQEGRATGEGRLDALVAFTTQVVETRGQVDDEGLSAFLGAGFSRAQVLEVVTLVAQKVVSNYTNHLAGVPLDEPFQAFRWTPTGR